MNDEALLTLLIVWGSEVPIQTTFTGRWAGGGYYKIQFLHKKWPRSLMPSKEGVAQIPLGGTASGFPGVSAGAEG
jgi:hypothetical protein